jgi:hypothetical protein
LKNHACEGAASPPLVPAQAGTQTFGAMPKKDLDARLRGHERMDLAKLHEKPKR